MIQFNDLTFTDISENELESIQRAEAMFDGKDFGVEVFDITDIMGITSYSATMIKYINGERVSIIEVINGFTTSINSDNIPSINDFLVGLQNLEY